MRRLFANTLLIGLILSFGFRAASPATVSAATIHHYEYVFAPGFLYVYDMDNNHTLIKTVAVPTTAGVRGAVASVATGMLYISYGSDGNTGGFQLAYNLSTDQVVWTMSYSHGIDSHSISPDGTKIYMPTGETSTGGTWYVEDSSNGNDIATILSGGTGPHNTIVSPSGGRVYLGNRDASNLTIPNDFDVADTSTNLITGRVSSLLNGARPFTINSKETYAFITASGFIGFQVGDLAAGKVIYSVQVNGSNIPGFTTTSNVTGPSHGISLSPDDKEIYVVDQPNSYVHVFDVSGLPASAPVQVADIKLVNPFSGSEAGCVYDCLREGWLQHSRDGRFVYVGDSGDVIDTLTRTTIATLPTLMNSRQHIEIDFQDTTPIWAATSRSGIGYVNPLPPTFTTRITSPNLGSMVSGTNVAVSASVITTGTLSAVDLYKDGILYLSTTASPYSFNWDTTKDANGPHTLTVTALDAAGNTTSFSATFTVNNLGATPPSITTTSLPSGTQNSTYSATLAASGGTTPYTWSILSGSLPAGLTLASSTGTISGTPTATGTASITVQVTDANSLASTKALSLTINTSGGGSGAIALVQSNAIQGSGVGSLSVAFPASNTPGNLIIAFVRMSSTAQTVTVTDSAGDVYTDGVTQAQTADGHQVHIFYAKNILGGANTVKAAFSATNNHPWLAIYEYSGLSKTNPLDQTAHAQGSSGAASSGATMMTVSANELLFAATGLPAGYKGTVTAGSGYTMLQQDTSGSTADNEGEIVSTTGTYTATFSLSSSTSWSVALATFAAAGVTGGPPTITSSAMPGGTQNAAYSATLAASGGTTPYTWSIISGSLPAGLTLAPITGIISGTPTATGTASFTVQVTDANLLAATKALSLTVGAAPSITTTSLPSGTQNTAYSATLAASGGTTPYTWSIISGSLPAGLTLAPTTGIISGTPTATGTASFTVQVTDANSLAATKTLSLTISTSGGGSGTIALVQSNAVQGSGVGSVSAAFPAGNSVGNLIIAFVRMSSTAQTVTVTDSAGNVYTDAVAQTQAADGHQVHIFYAKNILGGTNTVKAAFSATNNHPWLAIYEYSGLSKTNPLDQTAHAQGSSGAASSGAAAMTVSANELVFAATGLPAIYAGTVTAGSGYTMLQRDASTSPADNEGEIVSATGTYTATFTLSSSTNWSAVLATFKP